MSGASPPSVRSAPNTAIAVAVRAIRDPRARCRLRPVQMNFMASSKGLYQRLEEDGCSPALLDGVTKWLPASRESP